MYACMYVCMCAFIQEETYRYVLLECDSELTAWSRLCIEQSDVTLLVGMAHTSPALSPTERECVFYSASGHGSGSKSSDTR